MTGKIIHRGSGASSHGLRSRFSRKNALPGDRRALALLSSSCRLLHCAAAVDVALARSPEPMRQTSIYRTGGKRRPFGLEVERAKGLLVLSQVLAQHVPQGIGLLRAEEDGCVIANRHLIGAVAGGKAEDELKIPHADAHLHTVGVGLAVVGRLGKIQLGLRWCLTHDENRLRCEGLLLTAGAGQGEKRPGNEKKLIR